MNSITEIVSEYKAFVTGGKSPSEIKGRILKIHVEGRDDYTWEVSHYFKPSETATTVYYPTTQNEKTIEEARSRLLKYLGEFRNDIEVERNDNY